MSASWVTGGRVWSRVVERHLATALLHGAREEAATRVMQRCMRVWRSAGEALGPASGASAVWEFLVRPCAESMGWAPANAEARTVAGIAMRVARARLGPSRQLLIAMPWGVGHDGLQRVVTRLGVEHDSVWVGVCNGRAWRWYDASRPYMREHVGIDLTQASIDGRVWQALWLLGQPVRPANRAQAAAVPWIDRLVAASHGEGAGTAAALRDGVASALAQLARRARGGHDTHLLLVFQWLFLLFAESRLLLPAWHPSYRRSYAISTLVKEAAAPRPPPVGLHESLVAMGRLGRRGGTIAGAAVAALNGPLFASALVSHRGGRIPDDEMAVLLSHLAHGSDPAATTPIDFAELGVEHLGSLYERLMAPARGDGGPVLLRKQTGAFYTPRLLSDLLVERTLDPLVREASAERILGLRILDPAMGSGALLASTLRYLVAAVEAAWIREGRAGPLDVPRAERDALPRRIAEQCLYGADINARAVHVAKLSLWLLSLAPDRPLTWLDAHVRVGNSLIGSSPATVLARAPCRDRTTCRRDAAQLMLFDLEQWHHEAAEVGPLLAALSAQPTDTADDAHEKTRRLASLRARGVLATWRARADAWCGAAMDRDAATGGTWRIVDDALRSGAADRGAGRSRVAAQVDRWHALARAHGCLHWSLEFPEVFEAGNGGFDAVIANPPWEMLRGDLGSDTDRASQRDGLGPLLRFVRRSGLYRDSGGHVNSYQLFLERMLHLLRPQGRLGCLLPGGVLVDHGAAALRRHLLDHAAVDRISILDNRDGLFPIHRSVRIVSITGTRGASTEGVLVDDGVGTGRGRSVDRGAPRWLSRELLRRGSGAAEAIPSLRDTDEVRVLEQVLAAPRLGGDQWRVRFGRELNATEDRGLLQASPRPHDGLPVVDGKHVQGFSVRPPEGGAWISPDAVSRALPDGAWRRWRLAYRDVSSPTNTRSLIAALLPPGLVTTHTLFCLRTPLPLPTQLYLCGMLNSLVADWFVRRYLGNHVTTRLMASLPVPRRPAGDARRRSLVRLAARLMRDPAHEGVQADLHLLAAELYGLGPAERATVAADFPRLPAAVRARFTGVTAAVRGD